MKIKESLNVTFDETPPPSKTSPLVDDDLDEEEAIKKQTTLAISMTEAEYVSAGKACQKALWMKQALIDYDIQLDNVPIKCDNKGAIDLSKNPVQYSRTKHIEILDDINIAESERYLPEEYLHPYKPLQRYQVDSNIVLYIEPYEKPEPVVTEDGASLDQNDQADQNDKIDLNDQNDLVQADEILTDDHLEHSNHNNDNHIIDNLPNTKDV
ncbi:hypothetical protein Tco_0659199 [Tanacetum coccineum]